MILARLLHLYDFTTPRLHDSTTQRLNDLRPHDSTTPKEAPP